MYARVLKRVLVPAAVAVSSEENLKVKNDRVCRPSELPVFRPDPPSAPVVYEANVEKEDSSVKPPEFLVNSIASVRQSITSAYEELQKYETVAANYVKEQRANADDWIQYLRQEDNVAPKAGAIGIGGLTGLIFGLRGGMFRKLIFASAGALGMASICYPVEAAEYSQLAITESRKYFHITYNFCVGAKKDDPPPELPSLPKLPSSLSEAWETVSKKAASLVSDDKSYDIAVEEPAKEVIIATKNDSPLDPFGIIMDSYEKSSEACHCPVGACLGQHDEYAPVQEQFGLKVKEKVDSIVQENEQVVVVEQDEDECEEQIIEIDEDC